MPKANKAHEQAYDDFMKETSSSGGYFKFGQGQTGFLPVYVEGLPPVAAFGKTININEGKERPRYVFYAKLVDAEDEEKLPENWQDTLYPIFVSKTMAGEIGTRLRASRMQKAATFTSVNDDGRLNTGELFVMHRVGTTMQDTKYTLSVAALGEYAKDLPEIVNMPEASIQDYADKCTEQSRERANAPTQQPAQTEFAGFR